jgi:hypothetical protein
MEELERKPLYKPMGSTSCIGCGKNSVVIVSSQKCPGWGVCEGCARKAVGIFDANRVVVDEFKQQQGFLHQ